MIIVRFARLCNFFPAAVDKRVVTVRFRLAIRREIERIVQQQHGSLRVGQPQALSLIGASDVDGVMFCAPTGAGKTKVCQLVVQAAAALGLVSILIAPLAVLVGETSRTFVGLGANVVASATEQEAIERLRARVGEAGSAGSSGVSSASAPTLFCISAETFGNPLIVALLCGLQRVGELGPIMVDEAFYVLESTSFRSAMWYVGLTLRALLRTVRAIALNAARTASSSSSTTTSPSMAPQRQVGFFVSLGFF